MTTTMTRRAALGAVASIPAIGAATAAPMTLADSDPLADAIAKYRAGAAQFAAIPSEEITMENEEAMVMATYGPAFDKLWDDCPPATSLRGVAEAIRYTLEENCIGASSAENTLRAALAFLDQEHRL